VRLLLQSAALAVAFTWPAAATIGRAAVGSPDTDAAKRVWCLWWARREAWSGEAGLRTTLANFPDGLALFPLDPLDAMLASVAPIPPLALANVLTLLHLTLLGLAAGWLGRTVVQTEAGAHAAGALAQAAAFSSLAVHSGVGELQVGWTVPLGLGCMLRHEHTARWAPVTGGVLGAASIACFYHGLFLAIGLVCLALFQRRSWRAHLLAALVAAAVVLPASRILAGTYTVPPEVEPGATLAQLVMPRGTADRHSLAYEGGRYLGLITISLATVGAVAMRRRALPWVTVLAVSLVLATGGWAFAALNAALDAVAAPQHFPARFTAPAGLALAVLGAAATRWRAADLAVAAAVVDLVVGDLAPWPRQTFTPPDFSALHAPEGAVLDLTRASVDTVETRNLASWAQVSLDRPFTSLALERMPDAASSMMSRVRRMSLATPLAGPVDLADASADLAGLRAAGITSIFLGHVTADPDPRAAALYTGLCGEPQRVAHGTLWAIP
jgi:hypothetical protein